MTGTHTQNPIYSRITMALMEDTGWYMPNYELADDLKWGRGLGCDFALQSCLEWMETRRSKGNISNNIYLPYLNIINFYSASILRRLIKYFYFRSIYSPFLQQSETRSPGDRMHWWSVFSGPLQFSPSRQWTTIPLSGIYIQLLIHKRFLQSYT